MIIAYALVCSCVWAVLQTLSEMAIAFPVSGNYVDYAARWVAKDADIELGTEKSCMKAIEKERG